MAALSVTSAIYSSLKRPATFLIAGALAPLACIVSVPADADVKAGVDAWIRGDYAGAVEQWRAMAAAGDADAQYNLGQAFKLGRGVSLDLREAEKLLRLASLQGHPQAEETYGLLLYQDGRRSAAVPWLERSADRGDHVSELIFGTMLFEGDVVTPDRRRAYALVSLAHQGGLSAAAPVLAQLDQHLSGIDREAGAELAKSIRESQRARETADRADRVVVTSGSQVLPHEPVSTRPSATSNARVGAVQATALPTAIQSSPSANSARADAGEVRTRKYRAHLGAFRVPNNARLQMQRLARRIEEPIALMKSRGLVVIEGSFASKNDALAACRIAKVECVIRSRPS